MAITLYVTTNDERSDEMAEKPAIVFVGNKTPMDYVLAIMARLSAGDAKEVVLKARGQAFTTTVSLQADFFLSRF